MEKQGTKKINLDYHTIKELRKKHTVREISYLMNVSVPVITKFIRENNLKLNVPHPKGNRMCKACGRRFDRKEMRIANIGLICEDCFKENKTRWKFLCPPYRQ